MQDIPFAVKRHPLRQSLDKRSACIGLHILAVYIVPQIKSPARVQSFLVVIHPVLGQQSTIFCGHALHIIRIPVVHFQPYGKLFFRMDARQLVHLSHMLFVPVYDFMRIDGRGNPLMRMVSGCFQPPSSPVRASPLVGFTRWGFPVLSFTSI